MDSTAPFIEFPYDPPEWTPARRDYILPTTLEAEADWVDDIARNARARGGDRLGCVGAVANWERDDGGIKDARF